MNKKAIKRCIEELKADKPKIDYVLGVLETLLDEEPVATMRDAMPSLGIPLNPQQPTAFAAGSVKGSAPKQDNTADMIARSAEAEAYALGGLIEKNLDVETNITLGSGRK